MTVNTKRKGANFELAVKHALTDAGWLVVKSSDSKGVADLVAIRKEAGIVRVLFVEAKGGVRPHLAPGQWNLLWETAGRFGATPVLADKVRGVRAPRFWRLIAPKSPGLRGVVQPREPFDIEGWAADAV